MGVGQSDCAACRTLRNCEEIHLLWLCVLLVKACHREPNLYLPSNPKDDLCVLSYSAVAVAVALTKTSNRGHKLVDSSTRCFHLMLIHFGCSIFEPASAQNPLGTSSSQGHPASTCRSRGFRPGHVSHVGRLVRCDWSFWWPLDYVRDKEKLELHHEESICGVFEIWVVQQAVEFGVYLLLLRCLALRSFLLLLLPFYRLTQFAPNATFVYGSLRPF